MVVEIGIVTVTTSSGHLVTTVGGQLVMVETIVVKMVEVVMSSVLVEVIVPPGPTGPGPIGPGPSVTVGGRVTESVGGMTMVEVGGMVEVVFANGGMTVGPGGEPPPVPVAIPVGEIPVGTKPVPVGIKVVLKN